jgi:hypothetical protein
MSFRKNNPSKGTSEVHVSWAGDPLTTKLFYSEGWKVAPDDSGLLGFSHGIQTSRPDFLSNGFIIYDKGEIVARVRLYTKEVFDQRMEELRNQLLCHQVSCRETSV